MSEPVKDYPPYQLLCKQHTLLDSLKTIVPAEGGGADGNP